MDSPSNAREAELRRLSQRELGLGALPDAMQAASDRAWLMGSLSRKKGLLSQARLTQGTESVLTYPVTSQQFLIRPCDRPRPMDKVFSYGNGCGPPKWDTAELSGAHGHAICGAAAHGDDAGGLHD